MASIWLPDTLSFPAKKSCIPLACGFSWSFWKSSEAIVMVQSAGFSPFSDAGPVWETSMNQFPPPSPEMLIWNVAPICFAASGNLAS